VIGLSVLLVLSRALSLIALGPEKASSAGVNIVLVSRLAIAAVVLSCSAAVAICGPVGFVGLVVPHIVRPLVGANQSAVLPGCILVGATVCLIADMIARMAFAPFVLHTGLMMDLIGGGVFAVIVRRYYLTPGLRRSL
jgi:iron complex transport system permease protein